MYKLRETYEAVQDVTGFALYMVEKFKNPKAAADFLESYDKKVNGLRIFPFGYRGVGFEYRVYEIKMKPYHTYNIFFVVDPFEKEIIILRILKDREDWQMIFSNLKQAK